MAIRGHVGVLICILPAGLATNAKGAAFLAANKLKSDVTTLPSGLQYRVVESGKGAEHPLPGTEASCHYEGRVAQNYPVGATFDSSFARGEPATFAPNQVIKGWTEAMQLMVVGDKWELFIPSELGYGDGGAGGDIGPGDALIFTLHMLELKGPGKVLTADEIASRSAGGGRGARSLGRGRGRGVAGKLGLGRGRSAGEL